VLRILESRFFQLKPFQDPQTLHGVAGAYAETLGSVMSQRFAVILSNGIIMFQRKQMSDQSRHSLVKQQTAAVNGLALRRDSATVL